MGTSFKSSLARTATVSAPNPAAEIQLIFLCVDIVLCIYDNLISCPLQKEYFYFFHSNLYTFYFIVLPYCIDYDLQYIVLNRGDESEHTPLFLILGRKHSDFHY